ncbi:MAG TPA: hypothetical protein PLB92_10795 [Rhodoglobus sp.]|nr:hypothetical protein [Rhodoglobus sp.]
MAVIGEFAPILTFEDWYADRRINERDGCLIFNGYSNAAARLFDQFKLFKSEMDTRVQHYWKYETIADAAIVMERPDLPNVSSGEAAGYIRRIARGVVQHTPNVTISSKFEEDGIAGVLANYIVKTKVIGDDEYSNAMQQHLFATMIRGAAIGFDCVIPSLLQNSQGTWYVQYDPINYRDVYPEPGAKDVRRASEVFIRRYLTREEVHRLIEGEAPGWDIPALKALLQTSPSNREYTDHQSKKHSVNSRAYEIITWYSSTGNPHLTYDASMKMLLRIEKNKHPLKEHPVFFFIPEYDGHQPLGRSILSLIYGRQEFQDWFLNGAMKLWRLNIEPPIIGYGVVNTIPNIGPGKYTSIPNPNAKVEAFEVNSNTLLMFNQITQSNAGNMAQLIGATDQQMAASSGAPGGMSQTPAGVQAQQQMIDTTTNNYQKALEAFFSRYCSYALTIYFEELKSVRKLTPTAETRKSLLAAGMPPEAFRHEEYTDDTGKKIPADDTGLKDGEIKAEFDKLATQYWVKTIPGSLTELENEKQVRLLNQLFVPLSQAMPALAQTGDPETLQNAARAMQFIVNKQIELSGSANSEELKKILTGESAAVQSKQDRIDAVESALSGHESDLAQTAQGNLDAVTQLQEQITLLRETQQVLMEKLGVQIPSSAPEGAEPPTPLSAPAPQYP